MFHMLTSAQDCRFACPCQTLGIFLQHTTMVVGCDTSNMDEQLAELRSEQTRPRLSYEVDPGACWPVPWRRWRW